MHQTLLLTQMVLPSPLLDLPLDLPPSEAQTKEIARVFLVFFFPSFFVATGLPFDLPCLFLSFS